MAPAAPTGAASITAIILTFNEAVHIERCITRLRPLATRIVVVDSFSTDATVDLARGLGVEVLQHPWKNHADQFAWGLEAARPTTDWVMRIDADEYLEESLQREMIRRLPALPASTTGVELKLKVIFRGRFIRWGGYYRTWLMRLWRNGAARMEQRWMDERMIVTHGDVARLTGGDLVDESLKDIDAWTTKHNGYATRHMIDFINLEYSLFPVDRGVEVSADPRARFKRFLRNGLYGRAPLYWRAVLYYFQRYVLRLGFLDGRQGFVWHFLQGFWLFVLMDAKIDEARSYIHAHGVEAFKAHLKDRYQVDI